MSISRMIRDPLEKEAILPLTNFTFPQVLARKAERFGDDRIAIREKAYGKLQNYTWNEYSKYSRLVGAGLISLGLRRGDIVGLVLDNHPEWLFAELGAQSVGGIVVPFFSSEMPGELTEGLNHVEAAYVFAQDQEQVDKLIEYRDELPKIQRVIYVDPTGLKTYRDNPWLISLRELMELGEDLNDDDPELYYKELSKGKPSDVALMMMTSGTTGTNGVPKMAVLSYENIMGISQKWLETTHIGMDDNWVSISPNGWIIEQSWGVGITLGGGLTINFPENPKTVKEDFRDLGPTVIINSSQFWEDLASEIRFKINDSGWIKRKLYNFAQKVGEAIVDAECGRRCPPINLRIMEWFARHVIFRPLLDRIGCLRLRLAYTGGHPISPEIIRFFRVNGLNLKQAYGLTEAGGVFQVQPDDEVKPGTVGKALPGTKVKVVDDKEIIVSSKSNFLGYYRDPEGTKRALKDGWLYTGDTGYFDDDGHLIIIGRKEDIMETADGRAFSPEFIETRLKFSPYIREALVWGDGKPYLTSFIIIDYGNVGNWAEKRKIPYTTYTDLSQQVEVESLIKEEVRTVNSQLSKLMHISKIVLMYKLLDADDGEITRTDKVKRKFISQQYKDLIDALYSGNPHIPVRGNIYYRDGQIGTIETNVRVIDIKKLEAY